MMEAAEGEICQAVKMKKTKSRQGVKVCEPRELLNQIEFLREFVKQKRQVIQLL